MSPWRRRRRRVRRSRPTVGTPAPPSPDAITELLLAVDRPAGSDPSAASATLVETDASPSETGVAPGAGEPRLLGAEQEGRQAAGSLAVPATKPAAAAAAVRSRPAIDHEALRTRQLPTGASLHRQRPTDPVPRWLVRGIALVGALVAAAAAVEGAVTPTGWPVGDAVLTGGFAYLVGVAASRTHRWAWLWLAAIACAAGYDSMWVAPAAVALVLAFGAAVVDHRSRPVGALVGALAVQTLLRLPFDTPSMLSAAVATVAVAPVLVKAYDVSSRATRRRVRQVVLAAVGFALVATAALALAALLVDDDMARAVSASEDALDGLAEGDHSGAAQDFATATGAFDRANDVLGGPLSWPARVVPVLGPHARTLAEVTATGEDLSRTAGRAAEVAPYQRLRPSAGQVDLDTLRSMQVPVAESVLALEEAQRTLDGVASPWLVEPVRDRLDDYAGRVDDALGEARMASDSLEVAPGLLGGDGTRRYFIAFANPAEARFFGGFIGAYGVLRAEGGKVTFARSGPISELSNAPGYAHRTLTGPPDYLGRLSTFDPTRYFQNLTASPDHPTNAEAIAQLFPQADGVPVDGVIYVDPDGLAALLQLTGPVQLPGSDIVLDGSNAADYLQRQQYTDPQFATDDERKDALVGASEVTFEALTERDLPSPREVARALGPAVDGGHLVVTTFDDRENAYFERVGARGQFLDTGASDYFSLHNHNRGGNKIDTFLQRGVTYDATVDPTSGAVDATATITLTNRAPSGGLPDYVIGNTLGDPRGTNHVYLSFYSPLGLEAATLDGFAVAVQAQDELGGRVYSLLVPVAAGATRTLEFDLTGAVPVDDGYRLAIGRQGTVNADDVSVTIRGVDGWTVGSAEGLDVRDGAASTRFPLGGRRELRTGFERR